MSIILKGIDLPEEGQRLKIIVCHNGKIFIDKRTYSEEAEAIQIPKGHGRIGDLDELQKAIRTDIMGGLNYERFIEDAPTILEAEE